MADEPRFVRLELPVVLGFAARASEFNAYYGAACEIRADLPNSPQSRLAGICSIASTLQEADGWKAWWLLK